MVRALRFWNMGIRDEESISDDKVEAIAAKVSALVASQSLLTRTIIV